MRGKGGGRGGGGWGGRASAGGRSGGGGGGGRGGGRGGGGWDQFAVGPQQILLIARHVNTYVSYPPLLMYAAY